MKPLFMPFSEFRCEKWMFFCCLVVTAKKYIVNIFNDKQNDGLTVKRGPFFVAYVVWWKNGLKI
jgi:hypothetical protein